MLFHHKASANRALTIQTLFESEATSGSPKAKLPRSVKLYGSELLQFLGEPRGRVELNHQGDVHTHILLIINQNSSKYSGSEPFHCRSMKTLKGVLLTLEKDGTPAFIFSRSEQRLTYWHLQKISQRQADDKRQGSNMDITNPVKQIVSQSCLWRRSEQA